jgi:hypothetical protein
VPLDHLAQDPRFALAVAYLERWALAGCDDDLLYLARINAGKAPLDELAELNAMLEEDARPAH